MVPTIALSQPPRIVFGNGCAQGCADYLAQRDLRHILVVSSPPVIESLEPLLASIRASTDTVRVHSHIDSEPTISMFEETMSVAKSARLDAVIGVGGGSAMDVAKLIAALATGGQSVRQVFGINLLA